MYRKILLPIDGSALATRAMPHAVSIARAMDAEIVVLRVVDSSLSPWETVTVPGDPAAGPAATTTEASESRLDEERERAAQDLTDMKLAIQSHGIYDTAAERMEGPAGEVIVRRAEELGCDLIVMSSHGRSGVKRALLGSVTDHVVRNTPRTAVLVVAPDDD